MTPQQYLLLSVLVLAVLLFFTKWISLTATVILINVLLFFSRVISMGDIFLGLTDSSVILAGAMFILGGAVLKTGAARSAGERITRHIVKERNVMLVFMLLACAASAFMSAIATISILVPIAIGVCQANKEYRLPRLLLPIAIACSAGGMITLIGKPANLMARTLLEENGLGTIGFFEYAKAGIPVSLAIILFMYFWGYRLLPDRPVEIDRPVRDAAEPPESSMAKQRLSVLIFGLVILGFLLESVTDIPLQITALCGILALLALKVITDKEAFTFVEWPTLILVAGMFPMAKAMISTGTADLIAQFFINLMGQNHSPILFLGLLFALISILTEVMSNTACCALFVPIAIAIGQSLSINPACLVMAVTIASGCSFASPIGTPINAYVMSYGGYEFKDYLRVGIWLNVLSWGVCMVIIPVFWPF